MPAAGEWKTWVFPILGGLAVVPVATVTGIVLAYGILCLRRVSEHQGRRGFLALIYGVVLGVPAGFYAGCHLAEAGLGADSRSVFHRLTLAGLMSLLAASITFIVALLRGVSRAERRGIQTGDRGRWSLVHIALPATLVIAAGAFGVSWWLLSSTGAA